MKTIIQLSDLHFGTERPFLLEHITQRVNELNPDAIIVSGDLTQRAQKEQFNAAKHFLNSFDQQNMICVPGNHDIALFNVIERFIFPLENYKKLITPNLNPFLFSDNVAILGINSTTPYKPMGGFITQEQLDYISLFFNQQPEQTIKILVMHHNLIKSVRHKIINDSEKIIAHFAACNINLILSGHIHCACVEQLKRSHILHNMYVITAGTAVSTRTSEPNSFNLIRLEKEKFILEVHEFINNDFIVTRTKKFSI